MYQEPRPEGRPRSTRRESSTSKRIFGLLAERRVMRASTGAPSVRAKTRMFQDCPFLAENWKVSVWLGWRRMPFSAAGRLGIMVGVGSPAPAALGPARRPVLLK